MVQTRNSSEGGRSNAEQVTVQSDSIAAKLESMDSMKEDIAALKGDHSKGSFIGGDPRGWILKAEKYFRYYQIPDEEKVEIASMHLEGYALDLYSWLSDDHPLTFWKELVQAFNKNFGPADFQNPDEHLCNIKQTGLVYECRQELAKRSSRVSNWPKHCLLGVFLNGFKEEQKDYVRIHKP
ncbi:uncharacterized protein LOC143624660 [Bidens hawaiensis]|uniref:uncharacterized protein LOC143624660 n=1 Tax=Bidens hawaiensis TaxID=980011 RepID=UPI004049EA0D